MLAAVLAVIGVTVGGVVVYAFMQPNGTGNKPQAPAPKPIAAAKPAAEQHVVVGLRPGEPLAVQLRVHSRQAELRGLRPFFEVGAIWCPPSKKFGDLLVDPQMTAALAGVYLIRADMDEFDGDPKLRELKVMAVPVFFELDADGEHTGRTMTGAAWGADTLPNMSAAIAQFCG